MRLILALKPQRQASKTLLGKIPMVPRNSNAVKSFAGIMGVTR
jgi:hypothetical protein